MFKLEIHVADSGVDFPQSLGKLDFEFPEIQNGLPLHPRTMLADVLEKTFWAEYNSSSNSFKIKTCSEYVILWAQHIVRQGMFLKEQVDITFYDSHDLIVKVLLDDEGDMVYDWPSTKGFWNDRLPLLR